MALADVVVPIIVGLVTNAIYDRLKKCLRPGRRIRFQFCIEGNLQKPIDAILETDDHEELWLALSALNRACEPGGFYEWDDLRQDWDLQVLQPG
jgi:hypothetical protein